jgi:hypothetical protein
MSRSRRQKRAHDGLVCTTLNGMLDTIEIVMVATSCKSLWTLLWMTPAIAERVWSIVHFRGPYPFGIRSCGTALGHSSRMMVPALLETVVQRHGYAVRNLSITDCLFNDSALCATLRYCTNITAIDVSQSDHRYMLNQPLFSSVLTSGSLVNLRLCAQLVSLQLRHTNVSQI